MGSMSDTNDMELVIWIILNPELSQGVSSQKKLGLLT